MRRIFIIISVIILSTAQLLSQPCVGDSGIVKWHFWQNMHDDDVHELYANEFYPETPDGTIDLFKLQTYYNFDNYYGSLVRGYIRVPENTEAVFNIIGDDDAYFFLSTDNQQENLQLLCYVDSYVPYEDHIKYESQTSDTLSLLAGQFYYFELQHVERGGSDHATVYWKTDFLNNPEWLIVDGNYLYSYDCGTSCQPRGTPCDDGDPSTTNDVEDGFCNCSGIPVSNNNCIGINKSITAYYWDSIPGWELNDLYNYDLYPFTPNRSEVLHDFSGPLHSEVDYENFGTRIQAFLSVPVTGEYEFNVTGNNQTLLYISEDEDPVNTDFWIMVLNSTGMYEHDKYVTQSTPKMYLEKGKYYYLELNHKENTWNKHFTIFWKTPWNQDGQWKRLSGHYLFNYDCEISCIPEGLPCDDGDPLTNNDQYDANCNCVGTPCIVENCDPIALYETFESCALTEKISNNEEDMWLSCQGSASPNPARGQSVWIQYDLGQIYLLTETQVWNYNALSNTGRGFKDVAVDFSTDGVNWTELGTFMWEEASGDTDYEGFPGPDFGNIPVRYVLVTSLSNWGDTGCSGFSKIVFNYSGCASFGSPCDDGDPNTINDAIDENCQCTGEPMMANNCNQDTLMLGAMALASDTFAARMHVNSISFINPGNQVTLHAGNSIQLDPGFEVNQGAMMVAEILPCSNSLQQAALLKKNKPEDKQVPEFFDFKVVQSEIEDEIILEIHLPEPQEVSIFMQDNYSSRSINLVQKLKLKAGQHRKIIRTKKLNPGLKSFQLVSKKHQKTESISVY